MAPERQIYTSISTFNIKDVCIKKEREFTKQGRKREDIG
jgi:hypothetical protein